MTCLGIKSRMKGTRLRAVGAIILGVCLGCEGSVPENERYTTVDSAGVEIVENHEPHWTEMNRWHVRPEPSLELGGASSEAGEAIYSVSGLVHLSDGRIVVSSDAAGELYVFSPDGERVDVLGGRGEGPGEFQSIGWVGRTNGDSIAAFDYFQRRITLFDPEGRVVRTFQVPISGNYWPAGITQEGVVLFRSPREVTRSREVSGLYWDSTWVAGYQLTNGRVDSIGRYSNSERMGSVGEPSGYHFPLYLRIGAGRDGFYKGWGDRFEIYERSLDGTLRRIIRRAHEPVEVTGEVLTVHERSYMDQMRLSAPPGATQEDFDRLRRRHQESEFRPWLPAFRRLLVDPEGYVWVEHYPIHYGLRGQDEAIWSVFSPLGRWLGEVRFPLQLEVHQVGHDFVLGLTTDELGLEYVRLHELERP